jgi:hypothetical protein
MCQSAFFILELIISLYMKHVFFIVVTGILFSCKPLVKTVYGVNKEIEFKTLTDYRNYVKAKSQIDLSKFYYIDSSSYYDFINLIVQAKTDYFFGTFINDSTVIKKSDYLMENESCVGRVLKEINYPKNESSQILTVKNESLKTHVFVNVITNQPLQFYNDNKKKIVLVYSYKGGTIKKNDFIEIQNIVNSTETYDLVILSLDKVFDLCK